MAEIKVTIVVWRDPQDPTLGIVQNQSSRGIFSKGQYLHHPELAHFNAQDILNVTCIYEGGVFWVLGINHSKQVYTSIQALVSGSMLKVDDKLKINNKPDEAAPAVTPASSPLLEGYYVSDDLRLAFTTMHKVSLRNPEKSAKMVILGPSGFGKTTIPKLFAEVTGRGYYDMNCGSVRDPEEWYGYREAQAGSTIFIESEFIRAVQQDNMVIVLNELNRVEPWLHNALYPLLDDTHGTTIHGKEFKVGKGVIFIATMNTGYKYTGVFEADAALINRFQFVVEVGSMPQMQEVRVLSERTGISRNDAEALVKVAATLRDADIDCSTRDTLAIAAMMQGGANLRSAIEFALIRRIPQDVGGGLRKKAMDLVNNSLHPYRSVVFSDDVFGYTPPAQKPDKGMTPRIVSLRMTDVGSPKFNRLLAMKYISASFNTNMNPGDLVSKLQSGKVVEIELAARSNFVTVQELLSDNLIEMTLVEEV